MLGFACQVAFLLGFLLRHAVYFREPLSSCRTLRFVPRPIYPDMSNKYSVALSTFYFADCVNRRVGAFDGSATLERRPVASSIRSPFNDNNVHGVFGAGADDAPADDDDHVVTPGDDEEVDEAEVGSCQRQLDDAVMLLLRSCGRWWKTNGGRTGPSWAFMAPSFEVREDALKGLSMKKEHTVPRVRQRLPWSRRRRRSTIIQT